MRKKIKEKWGTRQNSPPCKLIITVQCDVCSGRGWASMMKETGKGEQQNGLLPRKSVGGIG